MLLLIFSIIHWFHKLTNYSSQISRSISLNQLKTQSWLLEGKLVNHKKFQKNIQISPVSNNPLLEFLEGEILHCSLFYALFLFFLEEISKRPRSSASKLQSILILHSLNYNFALLQLWSHLLISISKPTEETGLKLAGKSCSYYTGTS